jgi:hypothetical protein
LSADILGDYYFQKKKTVSPAGVIKHCVIYAIMCLLVIIPVYNETLIIGSASLSVSHVIIEFIIYFYIKYLDNKRKYLPEKERMIYIIERMLHFTFISVIAFIYTSENNVITVLPFINSIFKTIGLPVQITFIWLLVLLLIGRPANITIKKLLLIHKPADTVENVKNAGGFIGLLERLVILLLLSINQYSAIGLVLTAKSIARYDQISKDQLFAEYYLLGTLLSTLIVITVYLTVI